MHPAWVRARAGFMVDCMGLSGDERTDRGERALEELHELRHE